MYLFVLALRPSQVLLFTYYCIYNIYYSPISPLPCQQHTPHYHEIHLSKYLNPHIYLSLYDRKANSKCYASTYTL